MTKKRRILSVIMAVAMVASMMFAVTANTYAATDAGYVTVSVVQNNFDESGNYVGGGNAVIIGEKKIENYQVSISKVEEYIGDGYKYLYLPADVEDPMNGQASVIDAIIAALDMNGVTDIEAGWDYTNIPEKNRYPGGYIHNINSDSRVSNTVTTYTDENGKVWNRSYGHGWNVAYNVNGTMTVPTQYASNIALTPGMNIIIDISYFNMLWE